MSGFLAKYTKIVTVEFEEGYWAKIRKYPRRGDVKAAQAILLTPELTYSGDGDDARTDTRGKLDTGGFQDELVARCLIDWNFTDEAGNAIPVGNSDPNYGPDAARRAAIALLPQDVFQKLLTSIEGQQNAARKKEAEKEQERRDAAFPETADESIRGDELALAAPTA